MSVVVAFAPDLLVRSKIDVAVRHYGVGASWASSGDDLKRILEESDDAALVVIDLDAPGSGGAALVESARELTGARIVGFCSHVETDLIRASRDAGANTVMANSTFATAVAGLVAEAAALKP